MNFLIDESVDAAVARALRGEGHTVESVWELEPGLSDKAVLAAAERSGAVLVTADRDFGELVFRLRHTHHGVLLARLAGLPPERKGDVISRAVKQHGDEMRGTFTVVTPGLVRIRQHP